MRGRKDLEGVRRDGRKRNQKDPDPLMLYFIDFSIYRFLSRMAG